ncbi:hypothetical protein ACSQ67_002145 [Phaseolus vulgaris]
MPWIPSLSQTTSFLVSKIRSQWLTLSWLRRFEPSSSCHHFVNGVGYPKGIITESQGEDSSDHVYTIVENMAETSKNGASTTGTQELLGGDEEEDRSVASVENQLRKEMTVYEKFILGMLTNFGSMALDRIHNTLKMFCIADPPYDKSLQQLQSFLSGLVSEEKLELRDGMYFLKK